jgi:hypothetical protein
MREKRLRTARSRDLQRGKKEATIRTLSVSLLAVAAIAASMLLTRHREASAPPQPDSPSDARELDAIRAAGL